MLVRCPQCEYSLQGSPSEGQCPECGLRYDEQSHIWVARPIVEIIVLVIIGIWEIAWFTVLILMRPATGGPFPPLLFYSGGVFLLDIPIMTWQVRRVQRGERFIAVVPAELIQRDRPRRHRIIPWSHFSSVRLLPFVSAVWLAEGTVNWRILWTILRGRGEAENFVARSQHYMSQESKGQERDGLNDEESFDLPGANLSAP